MFDLLNPNLAFTEFITFIFVLIRVSAIIVFAPVFGSQAIPAQIKIALSLIFSLAIYPIAKQYISITNYSIWFLALIIIKEVLFGAALAFTVHLIWAGVEFGAQLLGFMMGFSIANVLSPQENVQISILSEFMSIFAILIFLAINGHYIFIKAIAASFQSMPIGGFIVNKNVISIINQLVSVMFALSFKVLAPAIVALIITNVVFGIIARTMPQVNIIIVAFPLSIGLGLFTLGMSLNYSSYILVDYYNSIIKYIHALMAGAA